MENIYQNIVWITWRAKELWDKRMLLDIPFYELEELIIDFAENFESIYTDDDWWRLDYSEEIDKFTDRCLARELWSRFGDIPMDPETEEIERDWNAFKKGTHREEIWHWFEETFGVSVAKDLMYDR